MRHCIKTRTSRTLCGPLLSTWCVSLRKIPQDCRSKQPFYVVWRLTEPSDPVRKELVTPLIKLLLPFSTHYFIFTAYNSPAVQPKYDGYCWLYSIKRQEPRGNYPSHARATTFKALTGVLPCGAITYASKLLAQSLTRSWQGFKNLRVTEAREMRLRQTRASSWRSFWEAKLIIPSFKHQSQFSREETERIQATASLHFLHWTSNQADKSVPH